MLGSRWLLLGCDNWGLLIGTILWGGVGLRVIGLCDAALSRILLGRWLVNYHGLIAAASHHGRIGSNHLAVVVLLLLLVAPVTKAHPAYISFFLLLLLLLFLLCEWVAPLWLGPLL